MKKLLGFLLLFQCAGVFAAGTMTVTKFFLTGHSLVHVAWVGDSSDGSVPATDIPLGGLVVKVVTNPGSPAPTANYDIACGDPIDSTLDVFGGTLANRHTTTTEQVYPVVTGATIPVFSATCNLQITNNSVNSAQGAIDFYVIKN